MFPFPSRRAGKEICRAGLQMQGNALPLSRIQRFPEPKVARRRQGQSHNIAKRGAIPVPANRRCGRILGDQDLRQIRLDKTRSSPHFAVDFEQKIGDRIGRQSLVLAKIVVPAEG